MILKLRMGYLIRDLGGDGEYFGEELRRIHRPQLSERVAVARYKLIEGSLTNEFCKNTCWRAPKFTPQLRLQIWGRSSPPGLGGVQQAYLSSTSFAQLY